MTMKSSSPGVVFFLFVMLQISEPGLGSIMWRQYTFVRAHYTWDRARTHCRNSGYIDLATIYTSSDLYSTYMGDYTAWINLQNPNAYNIDTSRSDWLWADMSENNLDRWAYGEPQVNDSCAVVYSVNQRFYGTSCGRLHFFICYKWRHDDNHDYTFIPQTKTLSEAKQYCKSEGYTNLASFFRYENLQNAVIAVDFPIWIGLHRDGEMWKWNTGWSNYGDEGWDQGKTGDCASLSSIEKLMVPQNCEDRLPFLCYRDNLLLIKENKTWEEALEYCMSIGYKLVSVQAGADHTYMMDMIEYEGGTDKVWTGLRFLAGHWVFTNRVGLSYSDLPLCPVEEQHCGAFLRNDTASIHPTNCLEKWNFLCYK